MFSRRELLGAATAATAAGAVLPTLAAPKDATAGLKSMTRAAQPISSAERKARLEKVQGLMQHQKVGALLIEAGATLEYFTGVRWRTSERTTAAVIPAQGRVVIVTPFFEEPSIRESLGVDGDVHHWQEDESPFELLAAAYKERGAAHGALAVDPYVRFFVWDKVAHSIGGAASVVPGDGLVRACRMRKSPAELA